MVKIRLLRIGRNKMPYYRIVAADSKAKSNGAYIELLGQYDPLNSKISLKEDKIKKWLSRIYVLFVSYSNAVHAINNKEVWLWRRGEAVWIKKRLEP